MSEKPSSLTLSKIECNEIKLGASKLIKATASKVGSIQVDIKYKDKPMYFEMYGDMEDNDPVHAGNGVFQRKDTDTGAISHTMFINLEEKVLEKMQEIETTIKDLIIASWSKLKIQDLYEEHWEKVKYKKGDIREELKALFETLNENIRTPDSEEYQAALKSLAEYIPISLVRTPKKDSGYGHSAAAAVSRRNPEKKIRGTTFTTYLENDRKSKTSNVVNLQTMIDTAQDLVPSVSITRVSITVGYGIKPYFNLNSAVIVRFHTKGSDNQDATREKFRKRATSDEMELLKINLKASKKKAIEEDIEESSDDESSDEEEEQKIGGKGKKTTTKTSTSKSSPPPPKSKAAAKSIEDALEKHLGGNTDESGDEKDVEPMEVVKKAKTSKKVAKKDSPPPRTSKKSKSTPVDEDE